MTTRPTEPPGIDAPPSSEEMVELPLAGYPVPETVSTREHALHCFACGGALSHSCTCEHIRLHRDGLRSLIYWVQKDTLEAARAALPSTGIDQLVEADRVLNVATEINELIKKLRPIADDPRYSNEFVGIRFRTALAKVRQP